MLGDDRLGRRLVPPQSISGHAIRDRLHLVRSEALELRWVSWTGARGPKGVSNEDASTTLADLLRSPLVANPFSTMRASLRGGRAPGDKLSPFIKLSRRGKTVLFVDGTAYAVVRRSSVTLSPAYAGFFFAAQLPASRTAAARHVYAMLDDPEDKNSKLFVKAKNNLARDTKALRYGMGAIRRMHIS